MLPVCQVDGYAGLADYKVHVIIELSGDVWGKNTAYYAAASKGSDSMVLQPGVFHNKEEPLLPGDVWRDVMGTETPSVQQPRQVCEGWRVTPRQRWWMLYAQGPLIFKLQIPTPWAKTLLTLTQRFPKQGLSPRVKSAVATDVIMSLGEIQ